MTTFVLATHAPETSETLCDYLDDRVETGDRIVAVNSQVGGDETDTESIREGEDALDAVEAWFDGGEEDFVTVETHQFVRGNEPHEDVLACADEVDADEIVIGIRKRNPTAKVVFGSVAQRVLLNSNRPMVVIPREEV